MQWNIPDLLDTLQEETIDLSPRGSASQERIRELTLKKVRASQRRRRALPALGRLAAAAAIAATLALPAMAVAGLRFTDWLEGLEHRNLPEVMAQYASWENTEGFWQVGLEPREVTREGMTLAVREAQDSPVSGCLTIQGDYWLEKWNGEAFEALTPAREVPQGESREIRDGTRFETKINWADIYGALESGRYRLGKHFTYTYSDGKTVQLKDWAEFRIFNEEMTPHIRKCMEALEALAQQESYHVTWTVNSYSLELEVTERIVFETWKHGEDYLLRNSFRQELLDRERAFGELLRGGQAVDIQEWNSGDILGGVKSWRYDHLLSEELNRFAVWASALKLQEANVGEIWVEESQIGLISTYYPSEDRVTHEEVVFTFDAAGRLTRVEQYKLPQLSCSQEEKLPLGTLAVLDTPADEIRAVLDAQDVATPAAFSWEAEQSRSGKTSGFANTSPVTLETGYDAFLRAMADYEVVAKTHHASLVSYDPQADMWKVDFWWKNGNVHATVYLDGQGITRLTVMEDYE